MLRMFLGVGKFIALAITIVAPYVLQVIFRWKTRTIDIIFGTSILLLFYCVLIVALELNKHAKHEPGPAKRKRLRFDREILFVMSRVATQVPNNAAEVEMKRKSLAESYSLFFKGKGLREFNGLMSELAVRGYFDTTRHVHPDVYCIITDDGFEYYHKHLKKKRWAKELLEMGE